MPSKPPVTLALIGISVLVYLATTYLGELAFIRALYISNFVGATLLEVRQGEWWRLITPIFLHFGIFHVVFNLLWIWEFGRLIEGRHGSVALLGLTLLIGGASNLAQYYVGGPGFGGMSGVVYGYFGYLWIQGRCNPTFGIRLNPPIVYFLLGWLAIAGSGILEWLFNLRVANTAHLVGLLCGVAPALLLSARVYLRRDPRLRR